MPASIPLFACQHLVNKEGQTLTYELRDPCPIDAKDLDELEPESETTVHLDGKLTSYRRFIDISVQVGHAIAIVDNEIGGHVRVMI